ncbi:MAG: hypothetical protein MJ106_04820 [Lentisphaeria bacterium]|nr:hypothetical protein [Lentisphaeria bacterium]
MTERVKTASRIGRRFLIFVGFALALVFLVVSSRVAIQLVDIQYTMNAFWNLRPFQKALFEYHKQHGEFPKASSLEELQEVLDIHDYPFKRSNPPLHEIKYFPAPTPERPYLCYWESSEKWGVFRYLLPKHLRHQVLLVWEDCTAHNSYRPLEEFVKSHREYLVRQEEHRYKRNASE